MMRLLQSLERVLRNVVVYPLLRLLFRSEIRTTKIAIEQVHKLLILRHDRIGDMVVTTPIFRILKQLKPTMHIGVLASSSNAEIIRHDPNIDAVFILHRNVFQRFAQLLRARRQNYDVVLSFVFNRTTSVALLARLVGPKAVRISHADKKYQFCFHRLVDLPRFSVPMVESLVAYLEEVFGIELRREDLQYEVHIDAASASVVDEYLGRHQLHRRSLLRRDFLPYVVLNLSATDPERRISIAQAKVAAEHLSRRASSRVVVIHSPSDRAMRRIVRYEAEFANCLPFPERGKATLLQLASLMEGAQCVITPDTAVVHLASATKTPVLGFFSTMQGMQEWLPCGIPYHLVVAESGRPASSIPNARIIESIDQFLVELETSRSGEGGAFI